jgi:hypothetical protein
LNAMLDRMNKYSHIAKAEYLWCAYIDKFRSMLCNAKQRNMFTGTSWHRGHGVKMITQYD